MTYESRIRLLQSLKNSIVKNQSKITKALFQDFEKAEEEVILTEIYPCLQEIDYFLKSLKQLMKPKKVKTPITMIGSESYIQYMPKGKVLIISPWNYPFYLAMAPVISAIAAGNKIDLAPSELSPACSDLLKKLLKESIGEIIHIELGGKLAVEKLLLNQYDHIFFTGSTAVGQIIMEAAAKKLCPVSLELGGKSPVIIDETANLETAAQKIVWAKSMNSGQTCVAPDYLLIKDSVYDAFLNCLKKQAQIFEKNYPRAKIITARHADRLRDFLKLDLNSGAEVVYRNDIKSETRDFGLCILKNINWDHKVMSEEIFGPILPCLKFENFDDCLRLINSKDSPLASYLFSESKSNQQSFSEQLLSGGACINHLVLHLANHHLPFGGVGKSGIGAYHGKWGFEELSHKKAVLKAGFFDSMKLFYNLKNKEKFKKIYALLDHI